MRVGIIGAGPAGLTAAYRLQQMGAQTEVFEAGPAVGGLARSFELWGCRVDLGPHRYFSRDARVNRLWLEVVGRDYRMVRRQTRIFYRDRFYDYPLRVGNVLRNLGPVDAARCIASYLREQVAPSGAADGSFEAWVVGRFGRRLYERFFESYTEKLWGIPCRELDADFAAQRIKGFSLGQAVLSGLGIGGAGHATLVDAFAYPLAGNGEVYERMARAVAAGGGRVHLSRPVRRIVTGDGAARGLELADGEVLGFDHVVSTMPLTLMVKGLDGLPEEVASAMADLRYRNTVLVYLRVARADLFPDQWLYVHSREVRVGRVTNFRNWVPELYGDDGSSILALEYWCYDEDDIWGEADSVLIARGEAELRRIGLLGDAAVSAGHVVRLPRCYPVYARDYRAKLAPVIGFLNTVRNLWPIGRYGAFKYNNQDHSILMGLLAAENIADGARHDLWAVNTDYDSYHEAALITETGLVAG